MYKAVRLGVAAVFGLLLAITLLVSGAFAQSVNTSHRSVTPSANRVVATNTLQDVQAVAPTAHSQQAVQPSVVNRHGHHFHRFHNRWGGWGGWGDGGWGWGGGWNGGWGGWNGGWGCGC